MRRFAAQPSRRSVITPSRASMTEAAACSAERLERPVPSAGRRSGSSTVTRNSGSWSGRCARPRDSRGRKPERLRPFLQHGLGVAQRPLGGAHPLFHNRVMRPPRRRIRHPRKRRRSRPRRRRPGWRCGCARRHCFRRPRAGWRRRARSSLPHRRTPPCAPDRPAAATIPLVGARKGAKQHVGDYEAEHVVAEKFEPLIAAGAIAHTGQGGNMGERLIEQRRIGKR